MPTSEPLWRAAPKVGAFEKQLRRASRGTGFVVERGAAGTSFVPRLTSARTLFASLLLGGRCGRRAARLRRAAQQRSRACRLGAQNGARVAYRRAGARRRRAFHAPDGIADVDPRDCRSSADESSDRSSPSDPVWTRQTRGIEPPTRPVTGSPPRSPGRAISAERRCRRAGIRAGTVVG